MSTSQHTRETQVEAAQTASYLYDKDVPTTKTGVRGDTWVTGTWVRQDALVFLAEATADFIQVSAVVETEADAQAVAAQFPKSLKLRGTSIHGSDWDGPRGYLSVRVQLSANGVNKGANESGLKRYRSFARHAGRLRYEVCYAASWGWRGNLKSARRFARNMDCTCPHTGLLWPLGFMHLEGCSLYGGREDGRPWN